VPVAGVSVRRLIGTSGQIGSAVAPDGVRRFLGRERELRAVADLLVDARLVTLTGAPGIGKTRIAAEIAARHAGAVWIVELAPVGEEPGVGRAVASALGVQETSERGVSAALVERLKARSALLVLDNCEHLLGACAALAETLLAGCPRLRVLATSREALGVDAEVVRPVPPLSLPAPGIEQRPEQLLRFEAVELFVVRAAAAQPGFALTSYTAPHVVEICRRLEGIPLAIVLAAARAGALTPAEISQRLDDRFGLLMKSATGARSGGHTLEAALDWSYEALTASERALLRRLSVFAGGFDAASAREVCAGADIAPSRVPGLLDALRAKSLVDAEGVPPGRLRLLETIRAYGAQRLEGAGEAAATRAAHARHYLTLAERAEGELTGPAQERWLERLELERQDMRSALSWSLSSGHGDWSLRIAGALVLFWRVRGQFSEGRELLEAALARSDGSAPALDAKAGWGAGFLAQMAGDPDRATPLLERSLATARALGDERGCGRALLILGNCLQYRDLGQSVALLAESAALARATGDGWCLAHALGLQGFSYAYQDDPTAARALFEECLTVARGAGDKQGLRLALFGLGSAAANQGDFAAAEPLLRECLAVAGELGEDYTTAVTLASLGWIAAERGRWPQARELLDGAIELMRELESVDRVAALVSRAHVARMEDQPQRARALLDEALAIGHDGIVSPALALLELGDLLGEQGERVPARQCFEEALQVARASGDRRCASRALCSLGYLERSEGHGDRAAALLREAVVLQHAIGDMTGLVQALEGLAGVAVDGGRAAHAARLLGGADALVAERSFVREPMRAACCAADARAIAAALAPHDRRLAGAAGAGLPVDELVDEALAGPARAERPSTGWASLTIRQHEIAELVAEGMTNRQIGELLCLSEWTVKAHLSNIFRQLGLARRSQLAASLGTREIPAAPRPRSRSGR
jgi:predicted ATPase/DNA-binding CsgD family transcriptional regulator